jgi:predicted nuclease with TOPRIM domain
MAQSERTDLGAHVDLCAERYRTLEKKLDSLEERMDKLEEHIIIIRTKLVESNSGGENAANKTIITIGTAFGVALLTGLITVMIQFILKS